MMRFFSTAIAVVAIVSAVKIAGAIVIDGFDGQAIPQAMAQSGQTAEPGQLERGGQGGGIPGLPGGRGGESGAVGGRIEADRDTPSVGHVLKADPSLMNFCVETIQYGEAKDGDVIRLLDCEQYFKNLFRLSLPNLMAPSERGGRGVDGPSILGGKGGKAGKGSGGGSGGNGGAGIGGAGGAGGAGGQGR